MSQTQKSWCNKTIPPINISWERLTPPPESRNIVYCDHVERKNDQYVCNIDGQRCTFNDH